jgi:hypothetical protein
MASVNCLVINKNCCTQQYISMSNYCIMKLNNQKYCSNLLNNLYLWTQNTTFSYVQVIFHKSIKIVIMKLSLSVRTSCTAFNLSISLLSTATCTKNLHSCHVLSSPLYSIIKLQEFPNHSHSPTVQPQVAAVSEWWPVFCLWSFHWMVSRNTASMRKL